MFGWLRRKKVGGEESGVVGDMLVEVIKIHQSGYIHRYYLCAQCGGSVMANYNDGSLLCGYCIRDFEEAQRQFMIAKYLKENKA